LPLLNPGSAVILRAWRTNWLFIGSSGIGLANSTRRNLRSNVPLKEGFR